MTEKIKNSIDWFENFVGFYSLSEDEKKMFCFAIRSLKAWEEVLNELEKEKDFFISISGEYAKGRVFATSEAINIINQHLAEIEGK